MAQIVQADVGNVGGLAQRGPGVIDVEAVGRAAGREQLFGIIAGLRAHLGEQRHAAAESGTR